MRKILLAMAEDEHDKRSWRSSCMVAALIVLTLALNASSREQAALIRQAYNNSNDNVLLFFTSVVVIGQIIAATILINVETLRGDLPDKEALSILIFSHVGTIFLHDHLLSMGSAYTYLPALFFHPLEVLITLWIVTSTTSRPLMWTSLSIISLSCTFVSIRTSTAVNSDRTSLICILSTLAMILRNIVVRQLVTVDHVVFKLTRKRVMSGLFAAAGVIMLGIKCFASPIWLFPSLCGLVTCALSASLLFVTTQVLKSYSLPIVSLFCVWATLIEAIILTPLDHRPDGLMIAVSFLIVIFGHYLFFKDHRESTADVNSSIVTTNLAKPVNTHEQYTRIEFLLFAALVMGVIVFVFQPKVSQRDLNTLSFVGLDKVVRRLLMLEIKEEPHPVVEEQGQVQLP